jgi:MYXO-CTERM domain-containing protein
VASRLHTDAAVKNAWLVRTSCLAASAAALLATPTPAEACSPVRDPSFYPQLTDGVRTGVPTDGVIAFRADAYGDLEEALALLTIEVTQDGLPVAGAIETIEISSSVDLVESTDLFVVWRPEAAFDASSDYVASVAVGDPFDPKAPPTVTTLDITTGEGPAGDLPAIELSTLELAAEPYGTGPRVCCDDGNSCGFPLCVAPDAEDRPVIRATVGLAADDPMAAQAYLRLSSGVDDALAEDGIGGIAADLDGTTFQRTFDAAAGSYCFGAEIVSLIDGSVLPIVSQCEAHGDLELTTGPNPALEGALAQCVGEPYWEDTMEPYEPEGGTGDESGSGSGSDGGSGDDDGTGSSDGGIVDDSGGDDGNTDGNGSQNDDASGCACNVESGRGGWSALALFVLVGGWLRRRR